MKQKAVGLVLTTALSLGVVFGGNQISARAAVETMPVEISFNDAVSGKTLSYLAYYRDGFFSSNEENAEVVRLSAALSAQAYSPREMIAQTVETMGFEVVAQENYSRKANSSDCNFVAYTVARKEIGDQVLYGVFMRGTPSDAEWYSNFNVGASSDEHDGFSAAAWEIYNKLGTIVKEEKSNVKIWLTGHSRGGAVANIVGDKLNRSELVEQENLCVYTFASPSTTVAPIEYDNIYNYHLSGDVISTIPLADWGYSLYGKEMTFANNDEANATFSEMTGVTYQGLESTDVFVRNLTSWVPTRAAYYEKDTTFGINKSPVDIMTQYVVPFLINQPGYSLSNVISRWINDQTMLIYIAGNPGFIKTMSYYANNSTAVIHGHSPVAYLAYADKYFAHEHEFVDYESNGDATCTENGTETAICYCGEVYTREAENSALGHDYMDAVKGEDHKFHFMCNRCDEEIVKNDIAECTVSNVEDLEYFGNPITPSVTVTMGDEVVSTDHYTISYENNNGVGEAKIHLVGVNDYYGETEITFQIIEHQHAFTSFVRQNDATCTKDGTEKSVCDARECNEVEIREIPDTALGHTYHRIGEDKRSEQYQCVRCSDGYLVYHLSKAEVKVDQEKFFADMKSGNYFVIGWDDLTVAPENYKVVSVNTVEKEDYVVLTYRIEGTEYYTDTLEGTIWVKYLPDPSAWVNTLLAVIATVVGAGAIVGGVFIGIKKRRG